jgi:hypothetical protein
MLVWLYSIKAFGWKFDLSKFTMYLRPFYPGRVSNHHTQERKMGFRKGMELIVIASGQTLDEFYDKNMLTQSRRDILERIKLEGMEGVEDIDG